MKRSEMIEHIAAEMVDATASRKYSNETEEAYYKRKATGILDMIEGFGMSPPVIKLLVEIPADQPYNVTQWEPEHEE